MQSTRVCDMFEVMDAQKHGQVKCRSCGALLPERFRMGTKNKRNILCCAACGWEVTCGAFFDSYTRECMLPGSVPDIFKGFMQRWPSTRTSSEKMLLIDWLIHEFHVNHGIAGRPVGENVIQGSKAQVSELIAGLAAGPGSTPGLVSQQNWLARLNDPIRRFRSLHSYTEVLQIAARLGIRGRATLREDLLVAEIYRLAPEMFVDPPASGA
jgi:hypothetical protein